MYCFTNTSVIEIPISYHFYIIDNILHGNNNKEIIILINKNIRTALT